MTHRRSRLIAAFAGMLLLAVACGGGGDSATEPTTAATGAPSSEPPNTDPPNTDPATEAICGTSNDGGGFDEVACDQPHDAEFAGLVAAPTSDAPTDEDEEKFQLQTLCASLVDDLVARPNFPLAIDIGFVSTASSGGAYDGDIECWALALGAPEALTSSISETDLDTALGDYTMVEDLDIGTCFVAPLEEAHNIALTVPCTETDADLLFGIVEADEGDYPGDDAINVDGFAKCDEVGADYHAEIDLDEYFLTTPLELGYTELGQRLMLCTVSMSFVGADGNLNPEPDPSSTEPSAVEVPAGFVFGETDPVCSIQDQDASDNETYFAISCDEPHNAELVAVVEPPADTLPSDADEAVILFYEVCESSVAEATGADLFRPGVSIGFDVPGALGEAYEGPIACYATFASTAWVGSFQDLPLAEILGDQVIIADLAPGDCFVFADDSFDSGLVVACDEPGALMSVGYYEAADRPYPPLEELRAERAERCAEVLVASGLIESGVAGDPSSLSGSFPSEGAWNVPGRRYVTCDIEPA